MVTARQLRASGAGPAQGMPDERTLQAELGLLAMAMDQSAPFSPLMGTSSASFVMMV